MAKLLKRILVECGISQARFAALAGYTRQGLIYALHHEVTLKKGDIFEAIHADTDEGAAVRKWLRKKGLPASSALSDDPNGIGKREKRHKDTNENMRIGMHITYKAMLPGDPDKLETHKEAILITLNAMRHFKLKRNPFMNEISELKDIFLSEDHLFIKEMMLETARHYGLVAVYGEVGCGKSTMRKAVYKELADEGIQLIYPQIIDKARITATSLVDAIVMDISDEPPKRSLEAKTRQALRLLKNRRANGYRQVMLIEEAHLLNQWALKSIKQIWEFEDGYQKLVGIVLIGQPELAALLDETRYPQLRELIRRVTVAEIQGLSARDLSRYVDHKISRSNGKIESIFADDAFDAMARHLSTVNSRNIRTSKAYPLSVNNISARAMNRAVELGEPLVTAEIINSL